MYAEIDSDDLDLIPLLDSGNLHTPHMWDIACACFPAWSKTCNIEYHCQGCADAHDFVNKYFGESRVWNKLPERVNVKALYYLFYGRDPSDPFVQLCPKKTKGDKCPDCINNETPTYYEEDVSILIICGMHKCLVVKDQHITPEIRAKIANSSTHGELRDNFKLADFDACRYPVKTKGQALITHVYNSR
jgi:hypothetical protein